MSIVDPPRVFKYSVNISRLEADSSMTLMLPEGCRPLYAAAQGDFTDRIVLYAIVPTFQTRVEGWRVYVVGTGHPMQFDPDQCDSMGLVSMADGRLMFHVFIRREALA